MRSTERPPDAAKFTLTRWSASARDAAGAHTEGHAIGTEASIFARRLKLLNFLPSFTVNFAPAQKKSWRGPLGCSDAHTLPAAAWAPRGRQTLNRTQLLPTTKSLRPGDLPIVFSTPCQMGNFATASRRESDPFPPTRSRGVQRDSLEPSPKMGK